MSITVTPQEARALKTQNFVIGLPPFPVGSDMMIYHNPKTGQEMRLPSDPYSYQHYTSRRREPLMPGPAPAGLTYSPEVDVEHTVTEEDARRGEEAMAAEEREAAKAETPEPTAQPTADEIAKQQGQLSLFDYHPETDSPDQEGCLEYMLTNLGALPSAPESGN